MLLSVLIIYKVTNFFGFCLRLKSLLLCALFAFSVNFITLSVSAYLTTTHFALILAAVFLSACLVTFYNERLNRTGTAALQSPAPANLQTVSVEAPPEPAPAALPAAENTVVLPETREEPAIEKEAEPLSSVPAEPETISKAPVPTESIPEKPLQQTPAKPVWLPAPLTQTIAEIVHRDMENDHLLKLTAALAKLTSLDAILDYAYEQQSRHNYANALFAFRQALHTYEEDSYIPFIVIEMANIYKQTGSYDEAIGVYEHSLQLPVICADLSTKEQFAASISYLRIVKCILIKHKQVKMPFNKIPPEFMREIEFAFQQWTANKSAS